MKAFIAIMLLASTFGAFCLGRLAHRNQFADQCHAAGFEMTKDAICVYHSRYAPTDYLTSPTNAANFRARVMEYEQVERTARGL